MTKLSQTQPLKTIHINNICGVQTHVNEPFLDRKHAKVRLELHILTLFGQLELLLEKIHRLEMWKVNLRTSSDVLLTNNTSTVAQTEFIQNMSAKGLYKRAVEYMLHRQVSIATTESDTQGHTMQFTYLHQLYTTASRLYHDLALKNHKYIAYQLALLYVKNR
ncbi:hypothetical protein K501DRAFT_337515 [Backusella circina FSU 941]|nr:hypothetical protein K501DRAFT_337515 [Backusella circina FSU 941]